jgi:endonuclease-3
VESAYFYLPWLKNTTLTDSNGMTRKEKALYIIEELEKLYPETPIPLDHSDAYTLLIAVLLSAQCTDERVNKITPHLFAKGRTPQEMILLSVSEIREIIKPCGLSPRKSQAIHDLSHIILNKHVGAVPSSFQELEALPGVGHKTASVVMSQAFGVAAFPVDTHIHRLLTRWGITSGKNVEETERDAKKIFPKEKWNKLHLQIIFYGREYSPARSPKYEKDFITRTIGTNSAIKELV